MVTALNQLKSCAHRHSVSLLIVVLAPTGCLPDRVIGPPEYLVDDAAVIVSTESALLSQPVDIAFDQNGNLNVLDRMLGQILVLSSTGELLRTIGGEGAGPGEFRRPRHMTLAGDTVWVVDAGNGRLQTLTVDSGYVRSTPLPIGSQLGPMTVSDAGWLMMGTFGIQDALAAYYNPSGEQIGTVGRPPAPAATMLNFTEMKRQILAGEVPAMDRNTVIPLFAADDGKWLVLNGERQVRRYDEKGALQMSTQLESPAFDDIWADVVRLNTENLDNQRTVYPLGFFVDAEVVGEELWLMLNMPDDEPARMLVMSAGGTIERSVLFSEINGSGRFAVNPSRTRIFFTIPSTASIVSASLPQIPVSDGSGR